MRKTAHAFAPAAISSFFEIHDSDGGKPIEDLEKAGARGGGFGLQKGVHTKATVEEAQENNIRILINQNQTSEAQTTKRVIEKLLAKAAAKYYVVVEHEIEVPIGVGFGTSAGGALTAGLALKQALDLPLTYNQIGKIAHVAEIECQTGLGTVSSLTFSGGCVLVVEPGAPGICQIDRIPLSSDYVIVAGYLAPNLLKKYVLSSPQRKQEINHYGKEAMKAILSNPTLKNFLESCWAFSTKAGFATENTKKLVQIAREQGALGAAQNMIGEAVHALVVEKNADMVAEAFKQVLPQHQVIVSRIDYQGARLI